MRRIPLLIAGLLALALAVPVAASAHGRHHHRHHHGAKAHHARLRHFGGDASADPGAGGPADAGTVASFTDGTLTITLADGSTVSGKVTSDTEINCMGPTATTSRDGSQGEDQGDQSGDDQDDQGDDDGGDQGQASCDATDLVAGTPVHEAILRIGSGGAKFKLVLLDKQATS